ncbi:formyltetrahydrofolate deformylase [Beggiatoa alba B18LD]|uniref:Formyltetrahydrofolate deformylase n=1 Tax=Beggiatoa alba B18LD TaxID=395493 RepID=I3CJQ5_9GAMM|nr:formyltetrahydrofolate deformylase [Beggiatoa alba]EIJ43848.1 formyltetrahydrofolate deformylase [Beggiatoa alba B18LD]
MQHYILLLDCPDQKGLVYNITRVLYQHDLNIVSNNEFVDLERQHFFMRTEVEGNINETNLLADLYAALPKQVKLVLTQEHKKKIVVLATKEYHCLGDLLLRNHFDNLNAEILAVISNHNNLADLVTQFKIPFHYLPHENILRDTHEKQVLDLINRYNPDFLVLAKYMRILSPYFVSHFREQMINIHHSFLPAFIGANPYKQAFERGVKIIGATAHFVTNNLDEGPIIAQATIPVDHTHNAASMAQAGRDVETLVLAKALKLVFEDRVFISQNKTVIFD